MMTVSELIELLQKYDETLEVKVFSADGMCVRIDEADIYFDEDIDALIM